MHVIQLLSQHHKFGQCKLLVIYRMRRHLTSSSLHEMFTHCLCCYSKYAPHLFMLNIIIKLWMVFLCLWHIELHTKMNERVVCLHIDVDYGILKKAFSPSISLTITIYIKCSSLSFSMKSILIISSLYKHKNHYYISLELMI